MRGLRKAIDQYRERMTCSCGTLMIATVDRRSFSDPQYPRETFAIYEVLTCPSCKRIKERRTAIGH